MSVNAYTMQRANRDSDALIMRHAELVKRFEDMFRKVNERK